MAPVRILFFDDKEHVRRMLALAAQGRADAEVTTAGTVAAVRQALAGGARFDLVVCDYRLGDGVDDTAADLVRELEAAEVPVIVLTALPGVARSELPTVPILAKPLGLDALVNAARRRARVAST